MYINQVNYVHNTNERELAQSYNYYELYVTSYAYTYKFIFFPAIR